MSATHEIVTERYVGNYAICLGSQGTSRYDCSTTNCEIQRRKKSTAFDQSYWEPPEAAAWRFIRNLHDYWHAALSICWCLCACSDTCGFSCNASPIVFVLSTSTKMAFMTLGRLCDRRLDNRNLCKGSSTRKGAGLWAGQYTCMHTPALPQSPATCYIVVDEAGARSISCVLWKLGPEASLVCCGKQTLLCCMYVILHSLPCVRTMKLGPKASLVCCGTKNTAVLRACHPAVVASCIHCATDVGTALLALQGIVKAAQLTKVTILAGPDGRSDHPCRHRLPHVQLQVLRQPARC